MNPLYLANHALTCRLPLKTARSQLLRPVASVTFDDFPRSAWTVGGAILQRFGARGTYYAGGCFRGTTQDGLTYYDDGDLRALVAAGHEVGAHGYDHRPAPGLSIRALSQDARRNADALEPVAGHRLNSYAYPFGEISPRTKAAMGARFATARGIRPGVNAGRIDLAQLRAVPVERRSWSVEAIDAAVAQAVAAPGWVIFFTHDVSEAPTPYGCTPDMLTHVLERLAEARIDAIPVRHAMARSVFGEG